MDDDVMVVYVGYPASVHKGDEKKKTRTHSESVKKQKKQIVRHFVFNLDKYR